MKNVAVVFTLLSMVFSLNTGMAQTSDLYPQLGRIPDLSVEAEEKFKRRDDLLSRSSLLYDEGKKLPEKDQRELDNLLEEHNETFQSIWDIEGEGCSWYCGGGHYKLIASSSLKPSGNISYGADNAHDFSFATAWVEGVNGYGKGEYLEYHFANESPRLHTVLIHNGYVKSDKAWLDNSRVKTLRMDVNGRHYATLHLSDTKAEQRFDVGLLGRREDGEDLVLRFTIEDVYSGNKYDDTAITQIRFDGVDVHCLGGDTDILMADKSIKKISELKVGDVVSTYNRERNIFESATVVEVASALHNAVLEYVFEDGESILATYEHPFMVESKGWCSSNPEGTDRYRHMSETGKIEIGDKFVAVNEKWKTTTRTLREIKDHINLAGAGQMYTITRLSNGDNFIANGCITSIE